MRNDTPAVTPFIRDGRPSDIEAITELHVEVQRLHHEAEPETYAPPCHRTSCALVASRLADPATHYFVAEAKAGHVAGYLLAALRTSQATALTHAYPFVEIDEIGVRAEERRRGIARALSERVAAWAQEQGVFELRLGVRAFNEPARRAYAALGYEPLHYRLRRSLGA